MVAPLELEYIEDYDGYAHQLLSDAHAYVEGAYMPPYRVRRYREQITYLRIKALGKFKWLTRRGQIDEANDYLDCVLICDEAQALFERKPLTGKYSSSTLTS